MKTTHFVLLSSTIALGIVLQGCGRGSALKVSADRTAKLTGIKQVVQANAAADQAKVVYEIKTQKNVEESFINGVLTLSDRGLPIPAFRPE